MFLEKKKKRYLLKFRKYLKKLKNYLYYSLEKYLMRDSSKNTFKWNALKKIHYQTHF